MVCPFMEGGTLETYLRVHMGSLTLKERFQLVSYRLWNAQGCLTQRSQLTDIVDGLEYCE